MFLHVGKKICYKQTVNDVIKEDNPNCMYKGRIYKGFPLYCIIDGILSLRRHASYGYRVKDNEVEQSGYKSVTGLKSGQS